MLIMPFAMFTAAAGDQIEVDRNCSARYKSRTFCLQESEQKIRKNTSCVEFRDCVRGFWPASCSCH